MTGAPPAPAAPARRFRLGRWLLAVAALPLALVLLVAAYLLVNPGAVKSLAVWLLTPAGGAVAIQDLTWSLSPPSLELTGLSLTPPPGGGPTVAVAKLTVVGDYGALTGGQVWFQRVEARGLSLTLPPTAAPAAAGPPDLRALGLVWRAAAVTVEGVSLRLGLAAAPASGAPAWLVVRGAALELDPSHAGRDLTSAAEIALEDSAGHALFAGRLSGHGVLSPGPRLEATLDLAPAPLALPHFTGRLAGRAALELDPVWLKLKSLDLSLSQAEFRLGPLGAPPLLTGQDGRASLTGQARLDGGETSLTLRELSLGRLATAQGEALLRPGQAPLASLTGALTSLPAWAAAFRPLAPAALADLALAGPDIPFHLATRDQGRLAGGLTLDGLGLVWPSQGLKAVLGGQVTLTGALAEAGAGLGSLTLGGGLSLTGELAQAPWRLAGFSLELPLAGSLAAPASPGLSLVLPPGGLAYGGRTAPLGRVVLAGQARLTPEGAVDLAGASLDLPRLGRLTGDLHLAGDATRGSLAARDLAVDAVRPWLAAVWPPLAAYTGQGRAGLDLSVTPAPGGPRLAANLTLAKLGFASPDGNLLAQDLDASLSLTGSLAAAGRLEAALQVRAGQALYQTVLLDLGAHPLELRLAGVPTGWTDFPDLALTLRWPGLLTLTGRGGVSRGRAGWQARGSAALSQGNLAALYATLVRDPLSAAHPGLSGTTALGDLAGKFTCALTPGAARVEGRLQLSRGSFAQGEVTFVEGLDLDLPLSYQWGGKPPTPSPPRDAAWGHLRLAHLNLGGFSLGPWDLRAALAANRLYLPDPLTLPLAGGRVVLSQLTVDQPLSPDFAAHGEVAVQKLDLAQLPTGSLTLEGSLEGRLGPFTFTLAGLVCPGRLTGRLFGGTLQVDHLSVHRPFSLDRSFGADIQLRLVDLYRLSQALGVGMVTGRVDIACRDLVVAYNQPQAFQLEVRSQKVSGVPQEVSLQAVNTISVVGTGSGLSGFGVQLMAALIRAFPYQAIGFSCALKNDVFTVRGLISDDGVEYLVKKPPLMGINVINRNPDNRIAFSDMLDRLKRVTAPPSEKAQPSGN
ncbi:MAG: YdbH domain-containing protein [Deltaproteobacteria bacterium]|nr:YdbH domain-containing protein [Deltaproteobacteria bacterium]